MKFGFSKKIGFIALGVVVCALLISSTVFAESKSPKGKAYVLDKNKCHGPLLVEMGDHILLVSRDNPPILNLENGLTVGQLSSDQPSLGRVPPQQVHYGCDVKKIEHVQSVLWPELRISALTSEQKLRSIQQQQEQVKRVQKAKEKYGAQTLPNGIQKITTPGPEYYVTQNNKSQAVNNLSLVISCDPAPSFKTVKHALGTNYCRGYYLHPSGLSINYYFWGKEHPESEYIQFEHKSRARVQKMIDDAKNPQFVQPQQEK